MISMDEAYDLFPLLDKKKFIGAMYDPVEGHVDPYGVTHAYAKSAQIPERPSSHMDLRKRIDK